MTDLLVLTMILTFFSILYILDYLAAKESKDDEEHS